MRRAAGIAAAAVVLLGGSVWLIVRADEPAWSSRSAEALAELDLGLADMDRFYRSDAKAHFEAALRHDPDLVPARLMLLREEKDDARRAEELARLRTRAAAMTPRERYLVERFAAMEAGNVEEATRITEAYVERHPDDVWAVRDRAADCFDVRDYERSEALLRQVVEADPNRVEAHNMLGYTAMALGRFREAEERFRTYRFIAPDQANPHDSLAELLILVGRTKEARGELEAALALKPDFCASYHHLIDLEIVSGDLTHDGVDVLAQRAAASGCEAEVASIRCRGEAWAAFWRGECLESTQDCSGSGVRDAGILRHRCLVREGRIDEAMRREEELARSMKPEPGRHAKPAQMVKALLSHMQAVRASAAGEEEQALLLFQEADEGSVYWGDAQGAFKLFNLLTLAGTLEERGERDGAARLLDKVRQVNPEIAATYEANRSAFSIAPLPR